MGNPEEEKMEEINKINDPRMPPEEVMMRIDGAIHDLLNRMTGVLSGVEIGQIRLKRIVELVA